MNTLTETRMVGQTHGIYLYIFYYKTIKRPYKSRDLHDHDHYSRLINIIHSKWSCTYDTQTKPRVICIINISFFYYIYICMKHTLLLILKLKLKNAYKYRLSVQLNLKKTYCSFLFMVDQLVLKL